MVYIIEYLDNLICLFFRRYNISRVHADIGTSGIGLISSNGVGKILTSGQLVSNKNYVSTYHNFIPLELLKQRKENLTL